MNRTEPVDLSAALASFDQLWSPRIVARVNDYDIRVAKVAGEHLWHAHDDTDEFFLVLDGELTIALRDHDHDADGSGGVDGDGGVDGGDGREAGDRPADRVVVLPTGSVFVVPRGVEHKPASAGGASIMVFEPTGTSTVGDRHDPIPGHVDVTVGHVLA